MKTEHPEVPKLSADCDEPKKVWVDPEVTEMQVADYTLGGGFHGNIENSDYKHAS